MSTLSVEEVIEGLTDWLGDGVNSIFEQAILSEDRFMASWPGQTDEDRKSCGTLYDDITGYRIVVETTDGLKPHWMPTEIGCYQIVVRQGNMAEAQNGR
jgi:hypothetical protein